MPIYKKRLARSAGVCPECGHHRRIPAGERLTQLLDPGFEMLIAPPGGIEDALGFVDTKSYRERLDQARHETGLVDAALAATGSIVGARVVVAAMEFDFMGGSLGTAVGELITHAAETALAERRALVIIAASGGARMQEGALALMQMAKISQALRVLDEAGLPTISVITDPTYGGVAASFVTLCDVIMAEPGARMGFAGPRVIAKTIAEELPHGFQTAEFLIEHGQIDMIVPRPDLRPTLGQLLTMLGVSASPVHPVDGAGDRAEASEVAVELVTDSNLLVEIDAWQTVRMARELDRPMALDYISMLFEGFIELHGDRLAGDCPATVGGLATFEGRPILVLGQQKGHGASELRDRNFGMPVPSGYRKAARLMRLAEKVGIPVVTLIDTGGAYPGVEAEKSGQAVAIADNLRLMSGLRSPIVSIVVSEGGSGGALGLAVADRVLGLENAVYSVISPEGCAAILWRDAESAPRAARELGLGAARLLAFGVLDGVVREPDGGAQADWIGMARRIASVLSSLLGELCERPLDQLLAERHTRFRGFGQPPSSDPKPSTPGGNT